MASVKATSCVRELHESVAKDLGYSSFKKMRTVAIAVLQRNILSHFLLSLLGTVKAFVMAVYPACLIRL